MEIKESDHGDTLVVVLSGRLDSTTAPEFERHIIGRIESGRNEVVIDFAALEFISSAGLRVMLMAAKRVKAGKGRLSLCALNDNIAKVFEISGFLAIFTIYPDSSAALAGNR
jgi:anti-sigma B factor antagonist